MVPFVEQAVPHEAGHILTGSAFPWIPIRELAVTLYVDPKEIRIGDFATNSIEPSERAIAVTPPQRMEEYKLFVAGGLAGNLVAGIPPMEECLQSDRLRLARVTTQSLEDLAPKAKALIQSRLGAFNALVELTRQRFDALMRSPETGRHILLNQEEIALTIAGAD